MAWTWVPGLVTAAMMNTYVEARLQALESGGGPIFKAFAAATAATVTATYTPINWTTPVIDTGDGWASGTPSIYTVSTPGWYQVQSLLGFNVAYTGNALMNFMVNGTAQSGRVTYNGTGMSSSFRGSIQDSHFLSLNAGDQVQVVYYVSSLTNCALAGGSSDPTSTFELQWIAPNS